jgi:hypothetical protein
VEGLVKTSPGVVLHRNSEASTGLTTPGAVIISA